MSVQFDWEIDNEDEFEHAEHAGPNDDKPRPKRPQRRHEVLAKAEPRSRRSTLRWLIPLVVVLLAAAGAGATWARGRVLEYTARADAELRQAVNLEMRAYASLDEEVFLQRQDPSDAGWLDQQRAAFGERQSWAPALSKEYEYSIVETGVDGDTAWALIQETRPERQGIWYATNPPQQVIAPVNYQRVLFYRHTDAGWVHTAPIAGSSYWGETRSITRGRYTVMYARADEASVLAWLGVVAPLADRVCGDVQCAPELHWTVTLDRSAPVTYVRAPAQPTAAYSGTYLGANAGAYHSAPATPDYSGTPAGNGQGSPYRGYLRLLNENADIHLPSPSLGGQRLDGKLDGDPGFVLVSNAVLAALRSSGDHSVLDFRQGGMYATVGYAAFLWEMHELKGDLDVTWADALWSRLERGVVDEPLRRLFAQDGSVLPDALDALDNPPQGGYYPRSNPGIALSFSLIDYLVNNYGRDRLPALLHSVLRGDSAGEAVQRVIGDQDLAAFEREWMAYGRRTYGD